jgi:effector-binding domain-containing protein
VNDSPAAEPRGGDPELVTVAPATTAVVRGKIPMVEIRNFFDASFGALGAALSAQGVGIAGPAFALYHGTPTDTVDLEVGFVTQGTVEPAGDVAAGALPGGRVARTVHHGSFDGLGDAWARLYEWISAQGLTPDADFWEVYLTEPSPDMDPADLRTELNALLRD